MRAGITIAAIATVAIVGGAAWYMVDIDQTREGALPNFEVSGGQMPAYDAEIGSIDFGSEERTVTVPEVNITTEERTVEVPTVAITPPGADDS